MSKDLTRRQVLGAASTGLVATRVARSASTGKPALLGGQPVRTAPFPSWPVIADNEERAWMEKLYTTGWLDAFRVFHPEPHRYSWWSQRFPTVRAENKGWRIDYISVTENLKPYLKDAEIFPNIKHSDHCPVYLELDEAVLTSAS